MENDRNDLLVTACGIKSVKLEQKQSYPSYGYDWREGGRGAGGWSGCFVGDGVRFGEAESVAAGESAGGHQVGGIYQQPCEHRDEGQGK